MKKKSLSTSILIVVVAVLTVSVVLVAGIYCLIVNKQYFVKTKENCFHTITTEAEEMNSWMEKHYSIAETTAKTMYYKDMHNQDARDYLTNCVITLSDSIMECYIAWEDKEFDTVYFEVPEGFDPTVRGWYVDASAAKKTICTAPYIDHSTGKIVITIATPVLDSGNSVHGVVGLDIDLTALTGMVDLLEATETGYAILIDADNNVIIHKANGEYSHRLDGGNEIVTALTDIAPCYSEVLASTEIITAKDYDGIKRFYTMSDLGETGWKLLYAADYNDALDDVYGFAIILAIIAAIGIAIGGAIIFIFIKKKLTPLTGIEKIVTAMADGNLDHEYPVCSNDEIGSISKALEETCVSLKGYITEISRCLEAMSQGDFTVTSNIEYEGEFIALNNSITTIRESLNDAFAQIDSVTIQVSDGSRGVSSGATNLAGAVSQQTELITKVTKNINDITEQVNHSANNAVSAKSETVKAADVVNISSQKMEELLKAMNDIASSADEIVKINKTIEDIAFQTNILALNASVEAARAGDAGKGFAVVADEVRNLANKSGEASNSTSALIEQTVSVVTHGKEIAAEAAGYLSEVVRQTQVIETAVNEIANTSLEQKTQLAEISGQLDAISGVVQTTAATAEESAAASEELDGQVTMLQSNLSRFRL